MLGMESEARRLLPCSVSLLGSQDAEVTKPTELSKARGWQRMKTKYGSRAQRQILHLEGLEGNVCFGCRGPEALSPVAGDRPDGLQQVILPV